MQYAIYNKDPDGNPVDRVENPEGGELVFDEYEAATAWLVEAARTKKIPLKVAGYSIQCVDSEGNLVEAVPEGDAKAAGNQANELLASNKDVRQAVATMIAGRQMYAVAVTELERVLDKLEDVHPLVADVLVQTAAQTASEPFDETILFQGLVETVFPWMQEVCKKHTDEEVEERKAEAQVNEDRRRKCRVPIGVYLDRGQDEYLTRGTHVVFVGYGPAIRVVLDHITTRTLAAVSDEHPNAVFTVLRLADKATKEDAHERLVRLGKGDWEDCAKNGKSFPRLVGEKILPMLPAMPDLLVCDDMAHAHTGIHNSRETTRANETLRRLGKWSSDDAGCAFVGAIPLNSKAPPVLMGSEWERLKAHSVIRPVTVTTDGVEEGKAKITIGRDAFELVVDQELLQGKNKIVLSD